MKLRSALGVGVVLGLLLLGGCQTGDTRPVNGHAPTPARARRGAPACAPDPRLQCAATAPGRVARGAMTDEHSREHAVLVSYRLNPGPVRLRVAGHGDLRERTRPNPARGSSDRSAGHRCGEMVH